MDRDHAKKLCLLFKNNIIGTGWLLSIKRFLLQCWCMCVCTVGTQCQEVMCTPKLQVEAFNLQQSPTANDIIYTVQAYSAQQDFSLHVWFSLVLKSAGGRHR